MKVAGGFKQRVEAAESENPIAIFMRRLFPEKMCEALFPIMTSYDDKRLKRNCAGQMPVDLDVFRGTEFNSQQGYQVSDVKSHNIAAISYCMEITRCHSFRRHNE